jgi:hypothetical protein
MSEKNEFVSFMKRQVDVEKEIMASLNKGLRENR